MGVRVGYPPEALAMLAIYLLGEFRLERDGTPIPATAWTRRKTKALLKILALYPNHQLHKEQAMDLLWPNLDLTSARDNLYRNLSFLRQIIEPDLQRPADSHYITLNAEVLKLVDAWLDIDAFDHLLNQARQASDPVPLLEEALDLYRGDLLPEDAYEEWAISRREALRRAASEAFYRTASVYTNKADYEKGIATLQRLIAHDPIDEKAHRELMLAYSLAGRRTNALRQYEKCARLIRTELGVEPEPETIGLYNRILKGEIAAPQLEQAEPLLTEQATRRTNLPESLSPIIGRERELEEVLHLIEKSDVRLVTFTGPAGIGKTKLALEVASALAWPREPLHISGIVRFPNGVFFVPLAPVRDSGLVLAAVMQALDLKQAGDRSHLDTLKAYLHDKRLLLVLDNFEQVVTAGPLLAQLLSSAPGLKILVTSRELLRLTIEHDFPVSPLAVPDVSREPAVEYLTGCASIALFTARAKAIQPGFEFAPNNAIAVAQICTRLEGIPLAIELAAARIRLLTPQAMLSRLDRRLRLLVGGARDLPTRQQTLYDAIGWSYDLLTPQEQTLFARLAVFAGGWTEDAAAIVCESPNTLDDLAMLLDKSLIQRLDTAGEPRFTMLEMIREYASERLAESGDLQEIQARHARYFLSIATAGEEVWFTEQQRYWLERFDEEQYNFRTALVWALENDLDLALQLSGALWRYWLAHAFLTEGRHWLEEALARVPNQKQGISDSYRAVRTKALFAAGVLAIHQADYTRANQFIAQSLGVARNLGNKVQIANSLTALGIGATYLGDYERSITMLEESRLIFSELGHTRGMSLSLNSLSIATLCTGNTAHAIALAQESLALSREIGDSLTIGASLTNLGLAILEQGDIRRASLLLEESLALRQSLKDKGGIAHTLVILGRVAFTDGELERAADYYAQSLKLRHEMGDKEGMAAPLEGLAATTAAQMQPARAAHLYGAAHALREAIAAPMPPIDRPKHDDAMSLAKALFDEDSWVAAWDAGRMMTLDDAVAYALTLSTKQ